MQIQFFLKTIGSFHMFSLIKTLISENEKSITEYSLYWLGKSTDELPA